MNRYILLTLAASIISSPATAQEEPSDGEGKLIFGNASNFGNATRGSSVFNKGNSPFGAGNSAFGESAEREAFFEDQAANATPQPNFQGAGNSLEERKIRLQETEAMRSVNRADPENYPIDEITGAAGFYDRRCFESRVAQTYVPPNSPLRATIACPPGTQATVATRFVIRGSDGKVYPITTKTVDVSIVLGE